MDFMLFRSKFAWALINNEYLASEEAARTRGKKRNRENDHCYVSAPPHAKNGWVQNGTYQPVKDTSNIAVQCRDATNEHGSIVSVVWGFGIANLALLITVLRVLDAFMTCDEVSFSK